MVGRTKKLNSTLANCDYGLYTWEEKTEAHLKFARGRQRYYKEQAEKWRRVVDDEEQYVRVLEMVRGYSEATT